MRKRHHIVSRGYLRFFAEGERILLCDKTTRAAKPVGTADAFVRSRFNGYLTDNGWLDEVEDEWSRRENVVLPQVRRLIAGGRIGREERVAVKVLAAIHFARSYGLRELFERTFWEHAETALPQIAGKPNVVLAFERQYGHQPEEGEIEAVLAQRWKDMYEDNRLFVDRMVHTHNKALDRFASFHLQLIRPISDRVEFITGDSPTVIFDDEGRVGTKSGLGLYAASHLYMPLARHLGVALTDQPGDHLVVSVSGVQQLNQYVWRAAHRQVAAHPKAVLGRCLATSVTMAA